MGFGLSHNLNTICKLLTSQIYKTLKMVYNTPIPEGYERQVSTSSEVQTCAFAYLNLAWGL